MDVSLDAAFKRAYDATNARKFSVAEDIYSQILNAYPDNEVAMFGMGNVTAGQGQYGVAVNWFRRSVEQQPSNITALMNLAPVLRRCGQVEKAIDVCKMVAERLKSSNLPDEQKNRYLFDNLVNLGGCHINYGMPEKALELCDQALAMQPGSPTVLNHRGLALLEMGRWEEGFKDWEGRLERPEFATRPYPVPYWDGNPTDCLVIHGEQGVGDEVMFASCVEEAKKACRQVVIECEGRLVPIFARSFGVPCYANEHALWKDWAGKLTAKIPFGSLLKFYRPTPESCPREPYIQPRPDLVAHFKQRLQGLGRGKKIGITWQGGNMMTHTELRSVPLHALAPILNTEHTFVSLQYGPGMQMEAEMAGVHHWQTAIDDFERHFALIASLDLVISVTQSVVHFAGAMGQEVWCLTPSKPRWSDGREGNEPFYQNVTSFRQQGHDWGPIIREMAGRLSTQAPVIDFPLVRSA